VMMRLPEKTVERAVASMLEQMKEGWTFVSTFVPIRTILLLFALVSLMGIPYMVLLPVFAKTVLHGGPNTLGLLTGASGVGALISAISLALRRSVRGLLKMIGLATLMFGGGLILLGLSRVLWISMAVMVVVGFGMIQALASSNTVIQTLAPEDKRGRVMSYYTMAFVGMAPFGSLIGGALAHRFGAPHTVMMTGTVCMLGAGWYATQLRAMRKVMRPIYQEMGILPKPPEAALEERVGGS
jgi:MFS family permease